MKLAYHKRIIRSVAGLVAACLVLSAGVSAAESVEAPRPPRPVVIVDPGVTRHVLLVCGHPGDEEFRGEFRAAVDTLAAAFTNRWSVAPEHLHVLFGSMDDNSATAEALAAAARRLEQAAGPTDAVWVIVLGHAYLDGRSAWLNLPGTDIDQQQFADLFANLRAGEQVFFLTFPVSGYYLRPLAREGRVVITATEPDYEINAPLFPAALAQVLSDPPANFDADGDGVPSVFDLYIATTRAVAARYTADEAIPTEHAQLDDTADGRGSELQLDYLTPEEGGRFNGTVPAPRTAGDGVRSAKLFVPVSLE